MGLPQQFSYYILISFHHLHTTKIGSSSSRHRNVGLQREGLGRVKQPHSTHGCPFSSCVCCRSRVSFNEEIVNHPAELESPSKIFKQNPSKANVADTKERSVKLTKASVEGKSSTKSSFRLRLFMREGKDSFNKKYHQMRRCLSTHLIIGSCTKFTNHGERQAPSQYCHTILDSDYYLQADKLLLNIDKWSFNVFLLEDFTNGHALSTIVQKLFQCYGFSNSLGIDMLCLIRFIKLVEQGYHESNPYHNATHASDVVQAMHFNIQEKKVFEFLKDEEKMAAILAAACHDVDHPGVNQSFLIKTSNPLAILYQDKSVLENHHYRVTKSLLHSTGLLTHLAVEVWTAVDNILLETILATDISLQQEFLTRFTMYMRNNSFDFTRHASDRCFILQMTLKCADICNPCRPWPLYYRWSEMICEEFFKQGDCEEKLGITVLPSFDRTKSSVATIQTGFIQFIAEPLFVLWNNFAMSSNSKMLLKMLHDNENQWKALAKSQTLPTFADLYLKKFVPSRKSRKVLDVESKNINKSQNKNISMFIAKNYNRIPMKQGLHEVISCSAAENSECPETFCTRRRNSTPAQSARSLAAGGTKISKNVLSCPLAGMFTNKQSTKSPEKRYVKNASTRRASFPMNVCITHPKPDYCKGNESTSEGFALTGFLSFLYITAISKKVCPKEQASSIPCEMVAWPMGLRGVLGFGPKDRMTILCKHLFQYKTKYFEETQNSLNALGDLSIMTLLTKELFTNTLLS